jgi:hypothetical protein
VLPLLSIVQREKHVTLSKLLRSNWNLPKAKYLWIHYDEKWFYVFVTRSNAKKCPELGLEKEMHAIYHRNHISKVMEVWNDLESYVIARGFVLAYRIAAKVIEGESGNDFLNNADFHCEVRKDFANTATGIKRASGVNI